MQMLDLNNHFRLKSRPSITSVGGDSRAGELCAAMVSNSYSFTFSTKCH